MKCIHCQSDAKYSERMDRRCPKCRRAFAFEPKNGDALTDAAFEAAINRVSSGGSVRFTELHLYYAVARQVQRRSRAAPLVLGGLAVFFLVSTFAFSPISIVPALGLGVAALLALPSKLLRFSALDFDALWRRWLAAHGTPRGLVVRRSQALATGRARELPPDIHHYSFDRAVITDRPETVDLLLANNFHFENNCAVLSVDGYPGEAFDTVRAMLRHNPSLSVYVLHDASVKGCQIAGRLRAEGWFQASARIVDVGLGPAHAGAFKGCWKATVGAPVTATAHLSSRDAEWLSRFTLELAVVRPEQVLKRLFRAMSDSALVPTASGDGGFWIDTVSFSSDATASDGGGDSFG
jgi:hypothetical protein